MDRNRIEELTRNVANRHSRRTILKTALAVLGPAAFMTPEAKAATNSLPTGDLAYAVKNSGQWDIWVYSFDTKQNTQLTSEPYSDQWAPAYSHDGANIAYLSEQTDGSSQIWMMNPDGSNQRQITNWYSSESIVGVNWSPDDSQLIVTLLGDMRRLALMSAGGGELAGYLGPSSSFASTSKNGVMVFASDDGNPLDTVLYSGSFASPAQASQLGLGDAPVVRGDGAYVIVQIGAPGSRSIASYPLSAEWSALPAPPRVGDDSNPIWLTTDGDYVAFVSTRGNGESIQVARLGDTSTTPLAIAQHERVWYLSKRPVRERIIF